jgi:hypothetical protein
VTWENATVTPGLIAARDRKAHEFLSQALFVLDGSASRLVSVGKDEEAARREELAAWVKALAGLIAGWLPPAPPSSEEGGEG